MGPRHRHGRHIIADNGTSLSESPSGLTVSGLKITHPPVEGSGTSEGARRDGDPASDMRENPCEYEGKWLWALVEAHD
jgi:hypothetical protein